MSQPGVFLSLRNPSLHGLLPRQMVKFYQFTVVLWAIESGVHIRDSMTVTQKKAYWVIPNAVKEVSYAPVEYRLCWKEEKF